VTPFITVGDTQYPLDIVPLEGVNVPRSIEQPPFPQPFFHYVGVIILSWSAVDRYLNAFVEALLAATGRTEERWITKDFPNRARIFRGIVPVHFGENSAITAYLLRWVQKASTIQFQRNLVAHGQSTFVAREDVMSSQIALVMRHKGNTVEHSFTLVQLSQIGVDMCGLTAEAGRFLSPLNGDIVPVPGLSSQDIYDLQRLLYDNQTILHTLPFPPDPPSASQA